MKISGARRQHDPRRRGARRLGARSCTVRSARRSPRRRRRAPSSPSTRHTQPKVTDGRRSSASTTRSSSSTAASSGCGCSRTSSSTQTFEIAVGQVGLETPAGQYTIAEQGRSTPPGTCPTAPGRASWPARSSPATTRSNPIKARWLGIYDGVGIHGTADDGSIGTTASHGCIRMHIPDVEKLYDEVPVGAPSTSRCRRQAVALGAERHADGPRPPDLLDRTSSQPALQKQGMVVEECRSTSVPMKTPRSRLRRTANHSVEASRDPGCDATGAAAARRAPTAPASTSWRWVAT